MLTVTVPVTSATCHDCATVVGETQCDCYEFQNMLLSAGFLCTPFSRSFGAGESFILGYAKTSGARKRGVLCFCPSLDDGINSHLDFILQGKPIQQQLMSVFNLESLLFSFTFLYSTGF